MVRRSLRLVWLRGFLPALAVGVLWVISTQTWTVAQFGGASTVAGPPRFAVGRGIFLLNWGWPSGSTWIGKPTWSLGVMTEGPNGPPKPSITATRQPWKWQELEWSPEVQRGHVKVPLAALTVLLALVPAAWMAWRQIRHSPFACAACGYDLRGIPGETCPECGHVARPPYTSPAQTPGVSS